MRRFSILFLPVLALAFGTWTVESSARPTRSRPRPRPVWRSGQAIKVQPPFHGAVPMRRSPAQGAPARFRRKAWTPPPALPARPLFERIRRVVVPAPQPVRPVVSAKVIPAPHAIRNVRLLIRDRHLPRPPMTDIKGQPITAVRINNPPVAHKAVVQNPALVQDILASQSKELQTDHYYWHDEAGAHYCHYLDRRGHHWYGFYGASSYYWTRYQANRWWWYDPGPQYWTYYDGGYWWHQDAADPQTVSVYVNGGYFPYNAVQPIVDNNPARTDAEEAKTPEPQYHSDVDAPNYQARENDNVFAVVVGVENYARLPKADFARRDAEAVRAHLTALGYPARNVVVLSEAEASFSSIEKHVESWLARKVNADSRVFFYFSGHGAPDPKTGETYLMPWDGDPKYLADTGYPVARLFSKLNALPSRAILVVLDTCFSGSGGRSVLAEGTRPLVTRVDLGRADIGDLIVMTATASDEITGTVADQGHGLFTYYYFLKGLNGEARAISDGVAVQDLYDYLRPKVEDAARLDNREQSPQLFVPPHGQRLMLVKDLR